MHSCVSMITINSDYEIQILLEYINIQHLKRYFLKRDFFYIIEFCIITNVKF